MKKQILDALKAKFPGVSESILSRIADKLAKTTTNEEEVTTAVEGVTVQQLIDSYGDSRATEAAQSAVSNYEKKHGLKDGQKAQGGEPEKIEEPDGDDKDTPKWAKDLVASNKELANKIAMLEGEKITTERMGQLNKLIEALPEGLRKPYGRIAVESLSEEEFNTLSSEIATEVEGISSTLASKGAVFARPIGGGGTPESVKPADKEVDAVAKAMGL